jgi:hypothetical protein
MIQPTPTSTAATLQTEPAVVAAICSAKGRTTAGMSERRGLSANSRLLLLAAGLAIVASLTGWWAQRDRKSVR